MSCYSTVPNQTTIQVGDILTVKEVKDRLKCGLSTVYEMCDAKVLKSFKLKPGSRKGIRILASSLAELVVGRCEPETKPVLSPPPSPAKKGRPRGRPASSGLILRPPA
jgi:hypothetical protein